MIASLLLAAIATTGPAATEVGMAGKAFVPGRVTVLAGELVTWTNRDNATHTATAADRSFDSGHLAPGAAYTRRFDHPGEFAYRCELHRFMRGTVSVVALELTPPSRPVPAGAPAVLSGRAPRPGAAVELERIGTGTVATARSDEQGRFRFPIESADGPARYRAHSAGLSSTVVEVAVAPMVRLAARRGASGVSVRVHVVPPQPRAKIVLERHERERFGYVRLLPRAVRLDAQSRARVYVRTHRRLRLRVRLSGPVGGFARSVSGVVVVPRGGGAHAGDHH